MADERTYGPDEKEMGFKEEQDNLEKIDDSLEAIQGQPMNLVLSNFGKQFIKNERMSAIMFRQLKDDLLKFSKNLTDIPIYEQMEVIQLLKNIISKYDNWMTMQRQNIFLAYDSMKKVKETVEKYYITKQVFEAERESYEAICADIGGGFEAQIQSFAGGLAAIIPHRLLDNFKSGDVVALHKLNRRP